VFVECNKHLVPFFIEIAPYTKKISRIVLKTWILEEDADGKLTTYLPLNMLNLPVTNLYSWSYWFWSWRQTPWGCWKIESINDQPPNLLEVLNGEVEILFHDWSFLVKIRTWKQKSNHGFAGRLNRDVPLKEVICFQSQFSWRNLKQIANLQLIFMSKFQFKQQFRLNKSPAAKLEPTGIIRCLTVNNPFSILTLVQEQAIALMLQRSNRTNWCTGNRYLRNKLWIIFALSIVYSAAGLDEFVEEPEDEYDLIVSNPPFYSEDYKTENEQRGFSLLSRCLPFEDLLRQSWIYWKLENGISLFPFKEEDNFVVLAKEMELLIPKTRVKKATNYRNQT
jgi:tRNA1Val (adenine37-N6)-methyltransferase